MDRYLEAEQGPLAKLHILQHFCLLHYVCVPNAQHILCDGICDKCVMESSRGPGEGWCPVRRLHSPK